MTDVEKLQAQVWALELLLGAVFKLSPDIQAQVREAYHDLDDVLLLFPMKEEQIAVYRKTFVDVIGGLPKK